MSSLTFEQTRLAGACQEVFNQRDEELERQEGRRRKAERTGEAAPQPDPPRVGEPKWVEWAARILARAGLPQWLRDRDVRAALDEDLVGPLLQRLLSWPEFQDIEGWPIARRWTRSVIGRKDFVSTEVVAARPKVVDVGERQAWEGTGSAPAFRLQLSLPWWLLATELERERGLHEAIAYFGIVDSKPVLRKADIIGHACTLGRFGVRSVREADAVFHAQRHPSHELILREWGFDPITGEGQRFQPYGPAQGSILELAQRTRKPDTSTEPEA
jgi:hypothetical protein